MHKILLVYLAIAVAVDGIVDGCLCEEHQQGKDDGAGQQAEVDLPRSQLLLAIFSKQGLGLGPVCGLLCVCVQRGDLCREQPRLVCVWSPTVREARLLGAP